MSEITITPLGTVSPYPKGNCNCPGFLIQNGKEKILLDCGSGVSRLMNFPEDLKNLMIIISHLHMDHYSDLGSFRYASYVYHNLGYIREKIKVYYPFLTFMSEAEYKHAQEELENIKNSTFLDIKGCLEDSKIKHGNMRISFLKNQHEVETYSIKISMEDLNIVYTSDTGYNEKLIEFAAYADVLICESTFLKNQNCTDGHLTASLAGKIATEANVKKLVLTHFWPEINKQLYVEEAKEYFENTMSAQEGKKLVLRRN